jgi:type II secretory pathway component HofQ
MARLEFFRKCIALGLGILLAFTCGSGAQAQTIYNVDTTGMAKIDLNVQNSSITSVLRTFAEFAHVNIVPGPEVEGRVTAKIDDVPWLIAFDTVLRANGFGWEQQNDIIRVTTLEKLQSERLNEQVTERKREDFLPLETEVIKVSYANATEMKQPLETLLSSRGKIATDERTNALVVTDIRDRIARVREMASVLDFKTPQVEINAKLVDVDSRYVRDIGIRWELLGLNEGDAHGDVTVDALLPDQVGTIHYGLEGTDANFEATIEMLERDNKAEIISNPRITTADNKLARIIVGKKVPLVVADEAGNAITQLTTIGIKLEVTPHINQDGRVTLDLFPEVSDLSAQAETLVIVEDGQTAVIGGLIRTNEGTSKSGVPFLKDIPLLGYLFGSVNKVREDRELLIFVTPKIIDAEA